jgi:O-ureido-D-serine cyclo-ligase
MSAAGRIALVSSAEALSLDEDMPPLLAACADIGLDARALSWDDPTIDWSTFDAAVLRSTWDYVPRHAEFLDWAQTTAMATALFNPPDVVRWSSDKRYLRDLARAGVPVVPTRFVEPGADVRVALDRFLGGQVDIGSASAFTEFVIKPAVGAGSKDALRLRRDEAARGFAHLERLIDAGRCVLLQPYLDDVDAHGETAAIYIDDRFSHAIRKGPLLKSGGELVEGLFAAEDIRARSPSREEGRVAKLAYNAIPFDAPLYARVDLIRDASGSPCVMELELVEPSLFFAHAEGSALRFAEALTDRLKAS